MMKQFPNLITTLRLALTLPIFYLLVTQHFEIAFYLFLISALSDGIDGMMARHLGCTSRYGAIVDPVADKALVIFSLCALTIAGHFPLWLLMLMIARDICIGTASLMLAYTVGWEKLTPRFLSKINTVIQFILISSMLFNLGLWPFNERIIESLTLLLAATTLASFIDYAWQGTKLWQTRQQTIGSV